MYVSNIEQHIKKLSKKELKDFIIYNFGHSSCKKEFYQITNENSVASLKILKIITMAHINYD